MQQGFATPPREIAHKYDPALCTYSAEHEFNHLKTHSEVLREKDAKASQLGARRVPTPGSQIDVSLLIDMAEHERTKQVFARKGMRLISHDANGF